MDDLNEIKISITLDDGSVREGFARIQKSGDETAADLKAAFSAIAAELVAIAAAYITFETAKQFLLDSVAAAGAYEKALNNVNKALASAGSYTADASRQFTELAESIEATTTTSATQALQLEALARNYTATNEQAKALTKASLDLAAATGKSVESALQSLGGTLEGTSGRLAKLVPQLRSLTEYQLRTGEAIAIVGQRFKDAASGDINTYEGSIQRLGNAFEKFQKVIGEFITNSPTVRAVIQFLTGEFTRLAQVFQKLGGTENFFQTMTLDAIAVGKAINDFIIYPLELMANAAKVVANAVGAAMIDLVGTLANVAAKIVGFFSKNSDTYRSLNGFVDGAKNMMHQLDENTNDALKKIGNADFSSSVESSLNRLKSAVENAKPFAAIRKDQEDVQQDLLRMSGQLESTGQAWTLMVQGAKSAMALLAADAQKYMQQIGASVSKTLVGGVANGMAAIGRALVKGQDIFKAFAGAMLSALGQAAIQMGAAYILMGAARLYASYGADPTGWSLIGTGSAMSILGGALMAIGEGVSGGAPSTSTGGGGGVGGIGGGAPVANPADQVAGQKAAVTVNIHGDVFDTQETGLRIVELVNQAFTNQGATVLLGGSK